MNVTPISRAVHIEGGRKRAEGRRIIDGRGKKEEGRGKEDV